SLCRLNLVFILWISMMLVCSGFPVDPSMSTNPFHASRQLYGRSDVCLVLLSSCLAKGWGRDEELALGNSLHKRSFRNGVGAGIKKTSTRRAK
ncbi:NPS protein, partial [Thryothorus ludovicianus]|nr:NPS protein [Thryothorus ludovicianus]